MCYVKMVGLGVAGGRSEASCIDTGNELLSLNGFVCETSAALALLHYFDKVSHGKKSILSFIVTNIL